MRKWLGWMLVLLLLVVPVAVADEPYSGEVEISSATCFTDSHFYDGWKTTSTATWSMSAGEYEHNRFEMEVRTKTGAGCFWGGTCPTEWVTVLRVPYGSFMADISGHDDDPRFFLVDRFTGEETEWIISIIVDATCSFYPPDADDAWVWDAVMHKFGLKQVMVVE